MTTLSVLQPGMAETLADLAKRGEISISTGPFGSALHAHDYQPVGVAVVPTEAIDARGLRHENFIRISREKAEELERHRLQPGDIVFARRGVQACGRSTRVSERDGELIAGTGVITLRIHEREKIDSRFLASAVGSLESVRWLKHQAIGATMPNLNSSVILNLPIKLPRIEEQRAIAGVFAALDDKIEQNRRTAQALAKLARAIFRAWFVDFAPVKAKAAGATRFPSMPPPVFDALPATFVDSDIGSVPEGWGVKPLANVATFLNGLALQKYPPRGDAGDLPVIKIAQLRKGSTEGADLANGDVPEQYVIGDGDLLFSWSGTLEAAFWFGGKGALNQHLFKVTSNEYPSWLCLLWIHQHLPWFRTIAAGKATTMGHIKRGHLTEAQVVTATPKVLQAANDIIGPVYDLYAQTMLESRKLAQMRDYLMPKLLSGKVRVATSTPETNE